MKEKKGKLSITLVPPPPLPLGLYNIEKKSFFKEKNKCCNKKFVVKKQNKEEKNNRNLFRYSYLTIIYSRLFLFISIFHLVCLFALYYIHIHLLQSCSIEEKKSSSSELLIVINSKVKETKTVHGAYMENEKFSEIHRHLIVMKSKAYLIINNVCND